MILFDDTEKFNKEWSEGKAGVFPRDTEYTSQEQENYFLFKIEDIQYSDSYPYPVNTNPYNCSFAVDVKHVPTISNKSHFQFDFEFSYLEGNPVREPNDKSKKIIAHSVRKKLIEIAKFSIDEF